MNENLLEICEYNGIGYKPLIDYGTWRVAVLRYIDELIPDRIAQVERHNETDEVFVLMEGQAVLFLGDPKSDGVGGESITALHPLVLEPRKFYNVKCGTFHTVALSRNATILLVENRDTAVENSTYLPLNADLRKIVVETVAREIPEWRE